MGENPVIREREKLGMSRHELAVMAGVGPATVYQCERGTLAAVPATIRAVFEGLGVDGVALVQEYASWREALGERMFMEFRCRQGIGA